MSRTALLCAGGTGGHMFPAEALGQELVVRGWTVRLATDDRGLRYASTFPGEVSEITFRPPNFRKPWQLATSLPGGISAFLRARKLVTSSGASVVMGFGGYPTLAPMFAALAAQVPTMLHEQNAVLGRANRLLAKRVNAIASGFELTGQGSTVTGNPVRPNVLAASGTPYAPSNGDEPFNLLVFGGSQGAQFFAQALPAALALLPEETRRRIALTLQAREEDVGMAKSMLAAAGVEASVAPFFSDMPTRIAQAHFVISRAGASTVSELAVIGRPSLLVPYPYALDHDQAANAAELARSGGAMVVQQDELDSATLAGHLQAALDNGGELAEKAAAARATGRADAAKQLADLVERTAA